MLCVSPMNVYLIDLLLYQLLARFHLISIPPRNDVVTFHYKAMAYSKDESPLPAYAC